MPRISVNPGPTGKRAPENELGLGSFLGTWLSYETLAIAGCVIVGIVVAIVLAFAA